MLEGVDAGEGQEVAQEREREVRGPSRPAACEVREEAEVEEDREREVRGLRKQGHLRSTRRG